MITLISGYFERLLIFMRPVSLSLYIVMIIYILKNASTSNEIHIL